MGGVLIWYSGDPRRRQMRIRFPLLSFFQRERGRERAVKQSYDGAKQIIVKKNYMSTQSPQGRNEEKRASPNVYMLHAPKQAPEATPQNSMLKNLEFVDFCGMGYLLICFSKHSP